MIDRIKLVLKNLAFNLNSPAFYQITYLANSRDVKHAQSFSSTVGTFRFSVDRTYENVVSDAQYLTDFALEKYLERKAIFSMTAEGFCNIIEPHSNSNEIILVTVISDPENALSLANKIVNILRYNRSLGMTK